MGKEMQKLWTDCVHWKQWSSQIFVLINWIPENRNYQKIIQCLEGLLVLLFYLFASIFCFLLLFTTSLLLFVKIYAKFFQRVQKQERFITQKIKLSFSTKNSYFFSHYFIHRDLFKQFSLFTSDSTEEALEIVIL